MQSSTLPEIVRREGIPANYPIFRFRKSEGRGIIEFDLPRAEEEKPTLSPEDVLKRLEALQVDIGRPTNSVKIIRELRCERYPRKNRRSMNS
jgi:hypothetical protein